MTKPTHQDADIMLRLAELQALHGYGEAARFIWSDDFPASYEEFVEKVRKAGKHHEEGLVHRFLGWYETVGTLYRNGLINEDLLFDWLAVGMAWNRVRHLAEGIRAESGEPRMFENFEFTAGRAAAWRPTRP